MSKRNPTDTLREKKVAKHHHTLTENANGSWDYEFWNPQRQIPRSLECTQDVAWWLDRADFFDEEWFPGIKYFDSWEELVALAVQEPDDEEERHRAEWLETRNTKVSLSLSISFSLSLTL